MRRRDFLALSGAAVAWPLAAHAQQSKPPLIVVLSRPLPDAWRQAVIDGLADYGYVPGKNVSLEFIAVPTDADMPAYASQAIARHPDIVLTSGAPPARALQATGTALPIVFTSVVDPVLLGLVPDLVHPGGNMTGNTILGANLAGKALELLRELVPAVTRVAIFKRQTPSKRPYSANNCGLPVPKLDSISHRST